MIGLYKQFYYMNVLNCLLHSKDTVKAGPPSDAVQGKIMFVSSIIDILTAHITGDLEGKQVWNIKDNMDCILYLQDVLQLVHIQVSTLCQDTLYTLAKINSIMTKIAIYKGYQQYIILSMIYVYK